MTSRWINFTLTALFIAILSSCGKSLNDYEKSIIENDMAEVAYEENLWIQASSLDDYLYEAVEAYADKGHEEMQSKIDSYNASVSLFGGGWDVAELFGTSAPELYERTYYRYVDYANDNLGNIEDVVRKVTEIIVENPIILYRFDNEENFSLASFQTIGSIPESIPAEELDNYKNLSLSKANKAEWGEMVMGTLKNPRFSPTAVIWATLKALSLIDYPEAEYAVYDDEEDGWEVGYDTGYAYLIKFVHKGDILEYQYSPTEYFEGYVDSKNNKLK